MDINGVINIYKEKGYTSHDVVAIVRKTLNRVKAGHTGTLDPEAEGVLPVCIGKATRLSDFIMSDDKEYRAEIIFGITTDTEDEHGKILETKDVNLSKNDIEEAIKSFIGEYAQIPPMYSAIKIDGRKLYDLAREGKVVERKERLIKIFDIQVLEFLPENRAVIHVKCSKGTYIRTLCADIGKKLGCGACMGNLVRTRTGKFNIENSIKLSDLKEMVNANNSEHPYILTIEEILSGYEKIFCDARADKYLHNGNKLSVNYIIDKEILFSDDKYYVVYDSEKVLIGLFTYEEQLLRPSIMFYK